jgi:glutathione S-transferase
MDQFLPAPQVASAGVERIALKAADRGYDADWIRSLAANRGAWPTSADWFGGERFGWADAAAAPMVNRQKKSRKPSPRSAGVARIPKSQQGATPAHPLPIDAKF